MTKAGATPDAAERVAADRLGDRRGRQPDGRASWIRLAVSLAIATVGGSGMWCVVVALPAVQAEFGLDRGAASIPYAALMLGVAAGGPFLGRATDRFGIEPVLIAGTTLIGLGFMAAAWAPNLTLFTAAHGLLIGIGCSASFAPLLADISFWFDRRRGIAVALVASGNYAAGAVWPPLVQALIAGSGWRVALGTVGVACVALLLPLVYALGRCGPRPLARDATPPVPEPAAPTPRAARAGLRPGTVQALLALAAVACCVAMSMPQVHIVAYCADLGYGPARGAEMLAIMLVAGIVSRIASGFVADRIGGLPTLLAGSVLQALALVLYTFFDGLASLYLISTLFGLFQGGIVPCYAIVVREVFPPAEAGWRVGICITASVFGMSLGGWMSGWIFDLTSSYAAAFANGVAWNLLNQALIVALMLKLTARPARLQMREGHA